MISHNTEDVISPPTKSVLNDLSHNTEDIYLPTKCVYLLFPATYFMTYHTILKTSSDFIDGLRHAREICDTINKDMNLTKHQSEVFPYR